MIHFAPTTICQTAARDHQHNDGGQQGDREQDPILLVIGKGDQANHQSGDDVAQGYWNEHQSGAQYLCHVWTRRQFQQQRCDDKLRHVHSRLPVATVAVTSALGRDRCDLAAKMRHTKPFSSDGRAKNVPDVAIDKEPWCFSPIKAMPRGVRER
jgi:hypothetical protein